MRRGTKNSVNSFPDYQDNFIVNNEGQDGASGDNKYS